MNKHVVVIGAILISIILLLLIIPQENMVDYSYTIEITQIDDINESYYALIPLPIWRNESSDTILNSITQNNETNYTVVTTVHGLALNISSDEPLPVSSKGKASELWNYDTLSMMEYNSVTDQVMYYIWSSSNATISLRYYIGDSTSSTTYTINSSLNIGWNLVEAEVVHVEA